MAYVQRKIPFVGTPDTNPETKPFFAAAAEGKFLVRRCTGCKKVHWYPRALCPFCFGECDWEEGSGKGKIYSLSVMKRGDAYAIAYVTLEEGPKMLTNIVDCDLDAIKIGDDVVVTFVPTTDGPPRPFFKPA